MIVNPKEIVYKLIDAINSHDPKAVASFCHTDATIQDPLYFEPLKGVSAIEKDIADFVRAFPDLRFDLHNLIVEGNSVATEGVITGTNNGPMVTPDGEISATGKRIVEGHRYYNVASLIEQFGLTQSAQS